MAFGVLFHVAALADPEVQYLDPFLFRLSPLPNHPLTLIFFIFYYLQIKKNKLIVHHLDPSLLWLFPLPNHPLTIPLLQDLLVNLLEDFVIEGFVKFSHELMFQPNLPSIEDKYDQELELELGTLVLCAPSS